MIVKNYDITEEEVFEILEEVRLLGSSLVAHPERLALISQQVEILGLAICAMRDQHTIFETEVKNLSQSIVLMKTLVDK